MTDTSAQAAQERAQQQLTKAMADMVTQVRWTVITSQVSPCGLHGMPLYARRELGNIRLGPA